MKKLLSMIFVVAMALVIVSCGSGGSSDDTVSTAKGDSLFGNFTAQTISGDKVDQTVFSGKKLTMINVWATFCSPCINEMPELGEISKEYADKGFQLIGIPADVTDNNGGLDKDMVAKAKKIVKQTKASYMHILPSTDLINAKLSDVSSVPETFFVDEEGNQIGQSYVGARSKSDWKKIIDELLKSVE